jgi:hypothetical protein
MYKLVKFRITDRSRNQREIERSGIPNILQIRDIRTPI